MKIFRHKENKLLYTIEIVVLDINFTNCNAYAGVRAYPFNWIGEQIRYYSKNEPACLGWVEGNFDVVAEQ